jgi:hypothetical protein
MNLKIGVLAIVAGFAGAVLFSQSQRPTGMPDLRGAVGWLNSGANVNIIIGELCAEFEASRGICTFLCPRENSSAGVSA